MELFIECAKHCLSDTGFFVFVLLTIADIASGFAKGIITKKPSSSVGLVGIMKHVATVLGVLLLVVVLEMIQEPQYGHLLIVSMYAVQAISVIGNLDACGVPLPSWLVEHFGDIKDRKDDSK